MTYTSLVTGGAGFIGSHVAAALLRAGHRVVVLDDLSGGDAANVPEGAHFHHGSVCDAGVVDALFAEWRFDYVFHLAAYAAEGLSHFIKRYNYTNNVIGSVNLINASVNAQTVRCFVFTSSIAVYGHAEPPMTEDMPPAPVDPYGIAKYAVEQELKVTHEMFGLPYVIFRPHNVYGERQNIGDRYRNVIGIFMNQILRGEPCTVFGDGEQTRAFSHIDDVAIPIARSIENPDAYGETFNIGGDTPYSVNELAAAVATAMDAPLRVQHLPARHEVVHAYSSHQKARDVLGVGSGSVPLADGLAQMAAWAKKHGPQEPSVFSGIEVSRNMPPSWQALVVPS
ncbi:NAD-dependent epimerase/dehydratase family protein [Nonomuraea sp. 3-1Str]|uniref:NAD-dependent epimerase/dehydratase family protein n=1 Tax=unclassified Nonomuraea TaxID=2593643 RepID=UPI00285A5380|nr:NAD-dependent epimerase/dehydratase family protein [Nonomuraea sp. 3-1Str]MDR8411102.1 NAD-dependent epimerase/dehydratase family protein [Nonomuraea sp. 3-1Str]